MNPLENSERIFEIYSYKGWSLIQWRFMWHHEEHVIIWGNHQNCGVISLSGREHPSEGWPYCLKCKAKMPNETYKHLYDAKEFLRSGLQ